MRSYLPRHYFEVTQELLSTGSVVMISADLRAIFHRPVLNEFDAQEFNDSFRERSYHIATLVSIIGAIDGTILTVLALRGYSPQYATDGIVLNLLIAWSSPLLLLALRGWSTRWYPWVISASVILSTGQYFFHVLQDLFWHNQFTLSALRHSLSSNAVLGSGKSFLNDTLLKPNSVDPTLLTDTFLQLQVRVVINTFWVTALVQLPFEFAATLATLNFIIYGGMMYLTATHHEFLYAFVRLGFIVVLGIMVAATVERRERRLFSAKKAFDAQLKKTVEAKHEVDALLVETKNRSTQYEDARNVAVQEITRLEKQNVVDFDSRADFMRIAFHDIRNTISGFALGLDNYKQALKKNRPELASLSMTHMEEFAHAADKLVSDMFDLSLYQRGQAIAHLEVVNVSEVVREVVATFRPKAEVKHIELRLLHEGDKFRERESQFWCMSNKEALRRVLTNLVTNAVKFTGPRADRKSGVVVGVLMVRNNVLIEVRDTGVGISEARRKEIWEYGNTTDGTNKEKGNGMGLSFVRAICAAMPTHELRWDSKEGKGSKFSLKIPACLAPESEAARQPEKKLYEKSLSGLCVLLVENNDVIRRGESLLLNLLGITVVEADSVEGAIRVIHEFGRKPDLIVTDFYLKEGENGADVISRVRARVSGNIPAVVSTADHSNIPVELTSTLDRVVLLRKPLTQDSVLQAVSQLYSGEAEIMAQHAVH